MWKQEIMLTGIVTAVVTGLLVSPGLAHRKYRPNPNGSPRWVLQRHFHAPDGSVKSTNMRSHPESIDLLDGVGDLISGIGKAMGDIVAAIFGGTKGIGVPETGKAESVKKSSRLGRYLQHPPGGGPARWVRNR